MRGDLASDFFAQIVPIFVPFVVIPFLLLGSWAIYRFYFKPAREKAKQQSMPTENPAPAYVQAPSQLSMPSMEEMTMSENPPNKSYDTGDLPPLDLLIEQPDEEPEPPAPPPTPAPSPAQPKPKSTGANTVTLNTGGQTVGKEVITVLRDESDGRLMVKIGETTYRTFTDSPNAKKEFSKVMKELSSVITQPDERPATPEPVEKPSTETANSEAEAMPSLGDLATPRQPKEYIAPPSLADGSMPGDLPSFKMDDNAVKVEGKRLGGTKVTAEPMPHLDIGAAVQTYVQWKIQHTPEYESREIHIHATPSGMLRIQVDDKYYDAVADVEDVEVREFLQHTIQEWQERQKR